MTHNPTDILGDDDARSVIIADNLASYTLVLPNTTELNGLLSSHSPDGWSDIAYWSATQGPNTETHETIAYGNGTDDGSVSDTNRRWVAFQLLTLAPAAPVIQTVTDESVLIPDADGDGPIVGESFRLLFISSNTINANSDNITVYNRFAQEVAASFPYINFSEQFRALISTPDIDARDNTNTIGDGVPIYWLNGEKVADDYPDFYDGGWDSQDGKSEIRTTPQDTFVMWTGSNSAGTGAQAVGSAAATANTGRLRAGQEISFAPENKRAQRHLYIMSPIIRVASAQSMTVPVDWALIPDIDDDGPDFTTGQSFRLLFITSDTRTATSADIETYNLAVQDTASNATGSGMPIADFSHQFRALISTREVDARDNTATTGDGVPIYWLNGEQVADDYDNFYDGAWDSQIGKNEHGSDITETTTETILVWTGSLPDGVGDTINNREAGTSDDSVIVGTLSSSFEIFSIPVDKTEQHNLYALSPVIIVHNIPTAPTSVVVTSASERLNVSWNIPDDVGDSLISRYTATASADNQPSRSCTTDGLFEVACTITSLTNDIEYSVIVIATNDGGDSEPSLPVMGTPTDLGICTRTQPARDAIIAATGIPDCDAINNIQLAAISSLDLSNKSIRSLQDGDFDGLTGLTSLDLSSNTLLNLPADIFTDLDRLTELHMNNNLLSSLPTGIFDNLTNLTNLNLASNFLSSLSANVFSDLAALETLQLNGNDLSSLPSGIFDNLTNLKNLHLNDNSLSSLPNGIFNNLTMLINLDLSLNGLSSLSVNTFSDLIGLNVLHLNDNFLSTLDENIFNSLTTLSLLDLSNNFLSTLHKNIFSNLDSLMELQLGFNDLSALPKEIFVNLANLQSLSLSINRIDELIPDTFDNLTNLNALYLDNNDLSILPPEIFSGLPLKELFLSYNHLNELPSDIFHGISNLQALGVDSNDGDPGSPFELLLTLVRTDPENDGNGSATVLLRIAEGAPFTMTVPIMISNGDVNNLNLTINAGDTESESITLSQNKISENTVMTISQIPSIPEDFSGIRLVADDALRLFPVIPVAPTNVIVTPGNQQLRVSWAAPSNDSNNPITGYTVTAVGAGQTHRCTADAQMNFCVITGLRNGIEYTVQVVTSNDNGNSEPSIPVTSAPTDVSVCERTSQVFTAIMKAISDDIDCADVTAVHLARIGELDISSSEVTVLKNGDFDGLTSLFRLDLSGNLLSTLPATIFNGLTNLRSLSLADNDLISLPPNVFAGLSNLDALDLSDNSNDGGEYTFTLTLVRTDETNLARGPATVSLQIAEGAPFTMTVPIITSNTESVSDVSLTIAAGNAESDVLTVTHQMDSTEHANLRLGTLPSIPSGFDGIQLVAGTALQLFPAVPGIPTDVVTTVFGVSQIRVSWTAPDNDGGSPITGYRADVVIAGQAQTYSCIANGAHRTACTTMTLPIGSYSVRVVAINVVGESNPSIPAIGTLTNFGFQAGLCDRTPQVRYAISAQTVDACTGGFRLLRLVGGITHLDLSGDDSGSEITSLMSGDFDGLAGLTELDLSDNSLTTLPETIFNSLIDLEVLDLSGNGFNTLPENIFYDLINLRVLRLDANNIDTLPATIFSGLDSLETLLLNGNDLMTLPMNIFAGLTTNLQTLDMADNPDPDDDDYIFDLTLSRVDGENYEPSPASLSLQIAEGAPTALTFPIRVIGTATVTDNAGNNIDELTLTAGSVESDVFHVTSAGNVTVGLGSVMMLPSGFTGVQFVVSDISLFFSTVCDRTTQVANAIVAAVSAATPCDEITTAQLAEITTLNLSSTGISSLQIGDFAGLTKLMSLDLSSNDLSELPANIFAGLINLEILRLNNNNLVTLPANIFADLTSLQTLLLNNNNLVTLPTNIFADLTSLQTLLLNNNDLVALPPNIFAGLISLQEFSIDNNPDINEFQLDLILTRTEEPDEAPGPADLVLELVEGAPTMISAQILVDGSPVPPSGAIGAITVTDTEGNPATELILPVGATVSNTIRVANTGPDKVTVTIGTLTTPTSTVEH